MIIVAGLDDIGSGTLACVDPKPAVRSEHWQTISHRATLFQAASPDILPAASQAVGGKFDFALIDGDHSTEGVVRDIRGVVPLLEEEVGRIRELVRRHSVAISGLGYYPNPLDPDPAQTDPTISPKQPGLAYPAAAGA